MFRTFADLFCGIGGFRLALENKGLKCVFSSEIDTDARATYMKRFKEAPMGDIRDITPEMMPDFDILCAGFPCQSFSISGSQQGFNSDNGKLFFEIVRIAKAKQPKVLLLENVPNLAYMQSSKVMNRIEKEIWDAGYYYDSAILTASHYGLPQARKRLYFVCIRRDVPLRWDAPRPPAPWEVSYDFWKVVNDCLLPEDQIDDKLYVKGKKMKRFESIRGDRRGVYRIGHINKGGQGDRVYSVYGCSATIQANGGGRGANAGLYLVNDKIRMLDIPEVKCLMGFPKDYILIAPNRKRQFKLLGNAVIPQMIELVYDGIKSIDNA